MALSQPGAGVDPRYPLVNRTLFPVSLFNENTSTPGFLPDSGKGFSIRIEHNLQPLPSGGFLPMPIILDIPLDVLDAFPLVFLDNAQVAFIRQAASPPR
jgi:hypothetical protein